MTVMWDELAMLRLVHLTISALHRSVLTKVCNMEHSLSSFATTYLHQRGRQVTKIYGFRAALNPLDTAPGTVMM